MKLNLKKVIQAPKGLVVTGALHPQVLMKICMRFVQVGKFCLFIESASYELFDH